MSLISCLGNGLPVIVANATFVLAEAWGELQRAAGASERITELLATESTIRVSGTPASLPEPAEGRISLQDVTFHYPSRPEQKARDGFNLEIQSGETIAIVGPSGAGKTTIANLLLRFWDPDFGVIRLDGVDVRTLPLESLPATRGTRRAGHLSHQRRRSKPISH